MINPKVMGKQQLSTPLLPVVLATYAAPKHNQQ
jgi:hypothetical protein